MDSSFSEDDFSRRPQLPSEQELLEGMQAVQAAVEAAEKEDGILGSPGPLRHSGSNYQNSGACANWHPFFGIPAVGMCQ